MAANEKLTKSSEELPESHFPGSADLDEDAAAVKEALDDIANGVRGCRSMNSNVNSASDTACRPRNDAPPADCRTRSPRHGPNLRLACAPLSPRRDFWYLAYADAVSRVAEECESFGISP